MSVDELLKAANQLSELDLDQLAQKILLLRAQRQAPVLSHDEDIHAPAIEAARKGMKKYQNALIELAK